jgi:hypothetical protein
MADKKPVKLVFRSDDANRVISWPCTISVPQDNGERQDQLVTARFKLMASDEVQKYFDALARLSEPKHPWGNVAFLQDALTGFEGLQDESGTEADNEAAKTLLLSLPYAVDGLVRGYFDMIGTRLPKN